MKFNIDNLMQQVQKMQTEMAKIKEEASSKVFEASSGGDLVTTKVNGAMQIISLNIDEKALALNDKTMLEDLIVASVNLALQKAQQGVAEELQRAVGPLPNIPGFNFNL